MNIKLINNSVKRNLQFRSKKTFKSVLKNQIITLLFILSYSVIQLFSYSLLGQTINQRDAKGLKQGYWEAVDTRGMPVYRGYFKDDKPIGEMRRFFPTGELRLILNYDNIGNFARVRFFFPSGTVAAQGNYIDNKRDSIWVFYNQSQIISSRVEYKEGKRNGLEQKFYNDGTLAEETNWKDEVKDGEWKQYFTNGQLKFTTTYVNGKIEGTYKSYYLHSQKEIEGFYRDGVPDGDWLRYDINGNQTSTIKYNNGTITNLHELNEEDQTSIKWLEEERNLPEPTIEDIIREAQEAQMLR